MRKSTVIAHSNIAFVKYWGKADHELNIPLNNSLSMNLSEATTTTSVQFDAGLPDDEIETGDGKGAERIRKHLDRIRALAGQRLYAHVQTANSFPSSAGIASSASGFAALTLAGLDALGIELPEKEVSALARRGSGSACRSIPGGFVEWEQGGTDESSYAYQFAAPEHWDLANITVVVSTEPKSISSSLGHRLVKNSPFWEARLGTIDRRLELVKKAILEKNFETFGREVEAEAISMHAIAMTSAYEAEGSWHSGIFYWTPDTLELLKKIQELREDGLPAYFTLDAGPTVHVLTLEPHVPQVTEALNGVRGERDWQLSVNRPAPGAQVVERSE